MPKGKHVRIPHFSITINISFNDVESMENCLNNEEFQNAQGKLVNIALANGAKSTKTFANPEI